MFALRMVRECAPPLLAALGIGGCKHEGPPRHYRDPHAMIAVFEDEERDRWQLPDRVVAALPLTSNDAVIADIGAGSGYFTRRLASRVPKGRVYAIDVDEEFETHLLAHREAWGTPQIEPILADYDDPRLPPDAIDLVFTANTYAYIRERIAYFTKVQLSLKPGGYLAVIEFRPDADAPGAMAPAAEHRVSQATAISELKQAGFDFAYEERFLPHQWFVVFKLASLPPGADGAAP